jgi:prevent-host-death family protein
MKSLTISKARENLYRLVDEAAETHEPVILTGKRHNAVLLSEEDWRAVQETLYLVSIPGMRESIREGLAEPLDGCEEDLDW